MNKFQCTGRMATDVELTYTPSAIAVANFRVAIKNPWKKDPQGKPGVDFIDVRAWRQAAEFAANYLGKGRDVAIAGRLQQESWEKEGRPFSKIIIVADDVEGIGPPPANQGQQQAAQRAPQQQAAPQQDPPQQTAPAAAPTGAAPPPAEGFYDPFADDV